MPPEVVVEVANEVTVAVPTVLEPNVAELTVVVLVAPMIVVLVTDDPVVLLNGFKETSGSEVVPLVVETLTDVVMAVALVVLVVRRAMPEAVDT